MVRIQLTFNVSTLPYTYNICTIYFYVFPSLKYRRGRQIYFPQSNYAKMSTLSQNPRMYINILLDTILLANPVRAKSFNQRYLPPGRRGYLFLAAAAKYCGMIWMTNYNKAACQQPMTASHYVCRPYQVATIGGYTFSGQC